MDTSRRRVGRVLEVGPRPFWHRGWVVVSLAGLLVGCSGGTSVGNRPAGKGGQPTTPHAYTRNLAASLKAATGNKQALCGFPLVRCPASAVGQVRAHQPPPQTVGSFVEVSLARYFQSDAILPPGKAPAASKTPAASQTTAKGNTSTTAKASKGAVAAASAKPAAGGIPAKGSAVSTVRKAAGTKKGKGAKKAVKKAVKKVPVAAKTSALAAVPANPLAAACGCAATGKYKLTNSGYGMGPGAIPLPFAPSTGTWIVPITGYGKKARVPFLVPAGGTGVKDVLDAEAQITLKVPPGHYLGLWLLEAGINGGGGPTNLAAVYRGGRRRDYPVYYEPDCAPQRTVAPQFPVYAAPYFLTPTGTNASCRYLYAEAVPINPHHTLTQLVLPSTRAGETNRLLLMALTLQRAPAAAASSATTPAAGAKAGRPAQAAVKGAKKAGAAA